MLISGSSILAHTIQLSSCLVMNNILVLVISPSLQYAAVLLGERVSLATLPKDSEFKFQSPPPQASTVSAIPVTQ